MCKCYFCSVLLPEDCYMHTPMNWDKPCSFHSWWLYSALSFRGLALFSPMIWVDSNFSFPSIALGHKPNINQRKRVVNFSLSESPTCSHSVTSVVFNSLRPHGLSSTRLLRPWDFPGKDTGVGCHFLLHRIFPTQGSNVWEQAGLTFIEWPNDWIRKGPRTRHGISLTLSTGSDWIP